MLYELTSSISFLHQLLPQGEYSLLLAYTVDNISLQAVYQIPTEDDLPTESVALALQRVFYHLQTSDQPVGKLFF